MSSEVVKKRGRPRKIIPELVEAEIPIVSKKTTKAKAMKAATKTAKVKAPAMITTATVKRPALKSADDVAGKSMENAKTELGAAKEVLVPLKPASEPTASVEKNAPIESAEPEAKPKDIPESSSTTKDASSETASPILAEVQKLKEKALAGGAIKTETIPTETATAKKPSPPSLQPKTQTTIPQAAPPVPKSSSSKPTPTPPTSKPSPPTPPNPKPQFPFAQMNSEIVSKITTRAGARPNTTGSRQLPPNYKSVSRKVTMAIVAMPIVIVTSYVLYQRLVLGEERKLLVEPVPAPMDPPRVPASTPKDSEPPKTVPSS